MVVLLSHILRKIVGFADGSNVIIWVPELVRFLPDASSMAHRKVAQKIIIVVTASVSAGDALRLRSLHLRNHRPT